MQFDTPILLIIFNRPKYANKVFESIAQMKPKNLFIVADGPRNIEEKKLCDETKEIIKKINWPCNLQTNFSEKNMGVRMRIESGITWAFEYTDRLIILEDDCVANKSFFQFCQEMLDKYTGNNEIMMISGDNPVKNYKIENSYSFSKYFAIWGWATWKRAWLKYDSEMMDWPLRKQNSSLYQIFKHKGISNYLTELFDKAYHHKINSWATRWFYTCVFSNGLSIFPEKNLVSNIGIEGVHSSPGTNNNLELEEIHFPLQHPGSITWDKKWDMKFFNQSFPRKPFDYIRSEVLKVLVKIKKLIRKVKFKISGIITIKPKNKIVGRVLLSYITIPFLRSEPSIAHTNEWECQEIVKTFTDRGYIVDVIEWNNTTFIPTKEYNFFIDIHQNIDRLSNLINKDCKKIFHITGTHWSFMNNAEETRLANLKKRRGIELPARRSVPPTRNIENSDMATYLGNEFTKNTYNFAKKPLFPIPISTPILFDLQKRRNVKESKNNFVWFGGTGFVHKGLDLVLEAFSKMPEYHLDVIGPIHKEKDFEKAFYKELYQTKNIKTHGWLSIESEEFKLLASKSVALVYPSCSEGGGGSIITCMHAGLIPIITPESSVNTMDFGLTIKEATTKSIIDTVKSFSGLSEEEIRHRSQLAFLYARENHTREQFSTEFQKFVDTILLNKK
jgi:glycosyltransferase involved in cell wall biosynthesis